MDTIPKFVASAFIIVIAVVVGMSLLICGSSVVSARSFYSNTVDAIGSVDALYEESVIEECKTLAAENGYVLTAEKVLTTGGQYYYELVLEYSVVAPFFGKVHKATISGHACPAVHLQLTPS